MDEPKREPTEAEWRLIRLVKQLRNSAKSSDEQAGYYHGEAEEYEALATKQRAEADGLAEILIERGIEVPDA